jgi:hypothetical protein
MLRISQLQGVWPVVDKIDPMLRRLLESPVERGSAPTVDVIVAVSSPPSEADLQALRDRGLAVRSVIGDVLTGSAPLSAVPRIAEHEAIVRIEASTPLYPEAR